MGMISLLLVNLFEKGMVSTASCHLKGLLDTGHEDLKETRVLNRIMKVTPNGLLYEAGPRHAERSIKAFELADSKPVVINVSNDLPQKSDVCPVASLNARMKIIDDALCNSAAWGTPHRGA